jgi:DNA excision repair protein ERCC-1
MFENKPPDMIMEKSNPDPHSKLSDALTTVKSINKTDAVTLSVNWPRVTRVLL